MTDAGARERALDPVGSFIVQAPAGSGKTTLLVQRLLALLANAEQPEEIIAITFTRKAAAEMRLRVLEALEVAATGEPPRESHAQKTYTLATAVLARDRELRWNLLSHGARLRVDTIDALNLWLAERLPMLSGAVAGLSLIDDARGLYRQAAQRCLDQLRDEHQLGASLRRLFVTFDNKSEQLEKLLVTLLPRRDRWLRHLSPGQAADALREYLEAGLRALVERELNMAAETIIARGGVAWLPLVSHASRHAKTGPLTEWNMHRGLPAPSAELLGQWRAFVHPFLTATGSWRKSVDVRVGFPPTHPKEKAEFKALLEDLHADDELLDVLQRIRSLPDPEYQADEWQTLLDFREVSIHAAAQLKVIFQQRRECDFVELAELAQRALGDLERPSDLLLALDHRIRHILVDEFQDTSHGQFELLRKLTAGWVENDGRTLFLVGDPMQSIYRFRDADMSLFLRAKASRLGGLRLRSLVLNQNFRSQADLVSWVNRTMAPLMPGEDDLQRGAAAFVASESVRGPTGAPTLNWLLDSDPAAEVRAVVEVLTRELARQPNQSIAVLVQNRSHLAGLNEHLAREGIAAHAVDIEPLHKRQIIQDLLGLVRALSHRLDRIAWLAVLRAPWCGVSLAGLDRLCAGLSKDAAIYDAIQDTTRREQLDPDDQAVLQRLCDVLHHQFQIQQDKSVAGWVEDTWVALHGPQCCETARELDDAQRFFRELSVLERREGLSDPLRLSDHFEELASLDCPTGTGIEIMTIHRAKGLEFDTVVLMGLGRTLPADDTRALRWLEMDRLDDEQPLLAPLQKADDGSGLYQYIKQEDRARDRLELDRRLYVALTRARDRLYVLGNLTESGQPDGRSALARLWVGLDEPMPTAALPMEDLGTPADDSVPPLRRLANLPPFDPSEALTETESPIDFEWVGQVAVLVGTAVHEWLLAISKDGVDQWSVEKIAAAEPVIRRQLRLGGIVGTALDKAAGQVNRALRAALEDDWGRWVLAPHPEAESELRVAAWTGETVERLIIDRTFVAEGTRWIVDYKTSTHEGANLDGFIRSEVERYQGQLQRYAAAMRQVDKRPIKVALYFPLPARFESWEPEL